MAKQTTVSKYINHIDSLDPKDLKSFISRLAGENGFLEGVADSINEGIMVVNDQLRIVYHNAAATRLLGIPEDCSKLSIAQFLKGVNWNELLNKRSARKEIEVMYPERRVLRFYSVPHRDGAYTSVILSDITHEFDQTESRVESERGKLVSMLAAGVAHEIGNPLNSLYLNLQLLQRMFDRGTFDQKDASESVREAKAEVERLDAIISQFLKAVRPAKMQFMPTDMKDVLSEALNFMRHEIEDRDVKVVCSFGERLPLLQADQAQLKQALYNIFKNALQAMSGGGTLTIRCEEEEDSLVLEISDTGKGIAPDDMNKIFQPFYTTKNTGNGLGLMIVERIVRQHGAKLSIDTEEGRGTRFTIQFPLNRHRLRVLPPPSDNIGILQSGKEPVR